jgi:hypothetical protein
MAQLRESALAGIRVLGREGALDNADPPPQRRSALAGRQPNNQVTIPEEPQRATGVQPIDGELRHHLAQQRVDTARARRGTGGNRPIITSDDDLCGAECFSYFIRTSVIPTGLEISNSFDKFDGQEDPRVWLEDFKAIVTLAGGSRDNALQLIQLYLKDAARAWLSGLAPESINSWEEFRRVFIANFKGTSKRPTSYEELRLCVQRAAEPLRSYISRWSKLRYSTENVSSERAIDAFREGLYRRDFREALGRAKLTSVDQLMNMANEWADGEDSIKGDRQRRSPDVEDANRGVRRRNRKDN